MEYPSYKFRKYLNERTYRFVSSGINGEITKFLVFKQSESEEIYSLSLGDLDEKTGEIDYIKVTNNNDVEIIIGTIAEIIFYFSSIRNVWIYFTGSTSSRTRLFRRILSNNIEEIEYFFLILGINEFGVHEKFIPNSNYIGFLIKRRKLYV